MICPDCNKEIDCVSHAFTSVEFMEYGNQCICGELLDDETDRMLVFAHCNQSMEKHMALAVLLGRTPICIPF